jgi:hypothetical protein
MHTARLKLFEDSRTARTPFARVLLGFPVLPAPSNSSGQGLAGRFYWSGFMPVGVAHIERDHPRN